MPPDLIRGAAHSATFARKWRNALRFSALRTSRIATWGNIDDRATHAQGRAGRGGTDRGDRGRRGAFAGAAALVVARLGRLRRHRRVVRRRRPARAASATARHGRERRLDGAPHAARFRRRCGRGDRGRRRRASGGAWPRLRPMGRAQPCGGPPGVGARRGAGRGGGEGRATGVARHAVALRQPRPARRRPAGRAARRLLRARARSIGMAGRLAQGRRHSARPARPHRRGNGGRPAPRRCWTCRPSRTPGGRATRCTRCARTWAPIG